VFCLISMLAGTFAGTFGTFMFMSFTFSIEKFILLCVVNYVSLIAAIYSWSLMYDAVEHRRKYYDNY
jgi:hypothetical protein